MFKKVKEFYHNAETKELVLLVFVITMIISGVLVATVIRQQNDINDLVMCTRHNGSESSAYCISIYKRYNIIP